MSGPVNARTTRVRACLFDMDGLLIDSEDKYTALTNEILAQFGKPELPWSVKAQLQGRPAPEASKIFHDWAQLPVAPEEFTALQVALQRKHFPHCQPLPGVRDLLANLAATQTTAQPVHIALASSSHRANFQLKTAHLADLFGMFPEDRRVLGDDPRIGKGRGKPLPDIYLLALETINAELRRTGSEPEIAPHECLVFEDAVPGVEAGRRAGMQVVWCPHPGLLAEYRGREEEVLAGLTGAHSAADKSDAEREADQLQADRVKDDGTPGQLNDGWADLLLSLEEFPYAKYGIRLP